MDIMKIENIKKKVRKIIDNAEDKYNLYDIIFIFFVKKNFCSKFFYFIFDNI
jgi:hypothetical protein